MSDASSDPSPRHLGRKSALPASPEEAVLDYVPNPHPGALYLVRLAALRTSLDDFWSDRLTTLKGAVESAPARRKRSAG